MREKCEILNLKAVNKGDKLTKFFVIPRAICNELKPVEVLLYAVLLDRVSLSMKNGMIKDKKPFILAPRNEMEYILNCSAHVFHTAMNALETQGFIHVKKTESEFGCFDDMIFVHHPETKKVMTVTSNLDKLYKGFYKLPKQLLLSYQFRDLSAKAKLSYAVAYEHTELSRSNELYDSDGALYFYLSAETLSKKINMGLSAAKKALKELLGIHVLFKIAFDQELRANIYQLVNVSSLSISVKRKTFFFEKYKGKMSALQEELLKKQPIDEKKQPAEPENATPNYTDNSTPNYTELPTPQEAFEYSPNRYYGAEDLKENKEILTNEILNKDEISLSKDEIVNRIRMNLGIDLLYQPYFIDTEMSVDSSGSNELRQCLEFDMDSRCVSPIPYAHGLTKRHYLSQIEFITEKICAILLSKKRAYRISGKLVPAGEVKRRLLAIDRSNRNILNYIVDVLIHQLVNIQNVDSYLLHVLFNAAYVAPMWDAYWKQANWLSKVDPGCYNAHDIAVMVKEFFYTHCPKLSQRQCA